MRAIPGKRALSVCALLFLATPAIAADPTSGKAAFARCGICHRVGEGARNVVGPELNGVVGRPAASVPGYAYSQAMKASGLTWTEDNLRAFLARPPAVVPGTKMSFAGLSDPASVDNLIAFLRTFKPDGTPAP